MLNTKTRWFVVVLYAIAMAWVESAVVVYLRTLIDRIEPYQPNPLPMFGGLGQIELGREIATLVMLLTVGALAGKTWRSRLAYSVIAFGVWDIFYYIFLAPMSGWPRSVFDWDILFLLPLPWWGPVLAPALVAALMIVGGTLVARDDGGPSRVAWLASMVGALLALYAFMRDAIHALGAGERAIRNVLPTTFDWSLFALALALMAMPVISMLLNLPRVRATALADTK
ncbi:MAG: hypothetical protein HY868_19595 [Chloroflexi bacterium]|nr:hypothetical protein [Chloroflexota bacterium]